MSILTAEGLFPALPLPPVQVQRGQGQEEVLGGSEGHLVLRRARGDGLKSGSGGVNTLQERKITPASAFGIYFWAGCSQEGAAARVAVCFNITNLQ